MKYRLRAWCDSDKFDLVKYANNINVVQYLSDRFPFPYTEIDAKKYLEYAQDKSEQLFAIVINEEAVGGIGFVQKIKPGDDEAELGFWLAESFWNMGIMSSAIQTVLDIGFETFQLKQIKASVVKENTGSRRILLKCGFKLIKISRGGIKKNKLVFDELIFKIDKEIL